jgi:hypothetical protein
MDDTRCARCDATDPGRYCAICGLDRRPGEPVAFVNEQRLATYREGEWLREHPQAVTVKTCPDCAEQIQSAARVCRYCDYRFDAGESSARNTGATGTTSAPTRAAAEKSPGGAAALGLLLAGLGHFYIGEVGRGLLILGGVLAAGIGLGLLNATATIIGVALLVVSAVDAHRGAVAINDGTPSRSVSGRMWAGLGIAVTILVIALANLDDGTGSGVTGPARIDTGVVESSITPELERQLQDQTPDATVTVDSVSCVAPGGAGGSCVADVSDNLGNTSNVSITFTVDSSTGDMVWHTD